MFKHLGKFMFPVILAGLVTACSANLGAMPGISPTSSTVTPGIGQPTGSGTQVSPVGPASSVPVNGGAPGVGEIGVHDNTVVANYIQGNMIINSNGVESAIPLPADQAAAIQAACPPGKQIIVKDNAGKITIDSQGQIFSFNRVEITNNQGEVNIS